MAESTRPAANIRRLRKARRNESPPEARINYVYRLFDKDDQAVYIGRSNQPLARLRAHHASRVEWAARVVGIEAWGPFNWRDVVRLERQAILTERPPGNKDFVLTKTHRPVVLP